MPHVPLFKFLAKTINYKKVTEKFREYIFNRWTFVLSVSALLLSSQVFAIIPFGFWKSPVLQDFVLHIPFSAGTESSYTLSDSTRVKLIGNVTALSPLDTDNSSNTGLGSGGFLDGTLTGVQWDNTNSILRLNTSTNTAGLDSSWAPQWNSLVAYWKLNGSGSITTNDAISATVGTNGVANNAGSFSYAAGKLNDALSFAAGLNRFQVNSALPISNTYTVSFWINLTSFPATISAPISATNSGSRVWQLHFNNTYTGDGAATYAIYAYSGGNHAASAAGTFTTSDLGNWHHIVLTYDSAASPKTQVYKDGLKLSMSLDNITGNFPTHDTLWVGGRRGDNNGCCDSTGSIDDLAFWSQPLSENEVKAVYDRQSAKYSGHMASRIIDSTATSSWTSLAFTTKLPFFKELPGSSGSEDSSVYSAIGGNLMTDLTNYWRFSEGSGSSLSDSVGGSTGTWAGTGTRWISGVLGNGGYFNATDSKITTSNGDVFFQTKFSVAFWIKVNAFPIANAFAGCALCRGLHAFGPIGSFIGKTNSFSAAVGYASNGNSVAVSNTVYSTGIWYHYAAVYDGTKTGNSNRMKMYINGVLQTLSFDENVPAAPYDPASNLSIGANSFSSTTVPPLNGSLDDIAIWSGRALTAADVLELYRRGANRAKYQIRTCTSANCSDQEALTSSGKGWKGPDNTQLTYFSELYNTTSNTLGGTMLTSASVMTFSNFSGSGLSVASNRYVQYRAILESDDGNSLCNYGAAAACSPEIQSIALGPTHYDTTEPSITSNASIGSQYRLLDTAGFITTLGGNGCSAGARYSLSADGTNFYYWSGSAWEASTGYATANDSMTLSLNLGSFHTSPAGSGGVLQVKTYLKSDGTSQCEVDNIQVNGKK